MATAPAGFVSKTKTLNKPDPVLCREQLEALNILWKAWGPEVFCRFFVSILLKKPVQRTISGKIVNTRLVPYTYHRINKDMEKTFTKRNITLKPRQIGATTYHIIRRLYLPTILEMGTSSLLISQTKSYGLQHFAILSRAHKHFMQHLPMGMSHLNDIAEELHRNLLHTQYSPRHELVFDFLDSRILVDCLGPNTFVQMGDGELKKICEVKVGDWVSSSKGYKTRVSWVGSKDAEDHQYKGQAYRVEVRHHTGFDVICSPNHKFLTQRGLVKAKDLLVEKDFLAIPKKKFTGIVKCLKLNQLQRLPGSGSGSQPVRVKEDFELNRETGFACGLYLAEGTMNANRPIGFGFCLAGESEIALFKRAAKAFRPYLVGVKTYRYHRGPKKIIFSCTGKVFTEWLKQNIGCKKNKHVPDWIWDSPKDFAIGFLEGWLCGDGGVGCRGRSVTGVSILSRVAVVMRDVAIALGLGGIGLLYQKLRRREVVMPDGHIARMYPNRFEVRIIGVSMDRLMSLVGGKRLSGKYSYKSYVSKKKVQPSPKYWFEDEQFVYFRLKSVSKTFCKKFWDLTVENPEHLYRLPFAVTHNTSENPEVGQGLPGISHLVCTEMSRWKVGPLHSPEEAMANVKESVHSEGTVDIECTANGMGGYFFEEWQRAKNGGEFVPHFYQWWFMEEYEERNTKLTYSELDDREKELVKQANLTLGQLSWRRGKVISLRHNFPEKYPEDDMLCFLTTGSGFFERDILARKKLELMNQKPIEVHGNGDYVVYKRRVKGRRYVIGADCCEGKEVSEGNSDFNAAVVLDEETGEEMAAYRSKLPPEDYGVELVDIAREYNNALLGIERNNHGGTVLLVVQRQCMYGNIYYHKEWFRERKQVVEVAGFPTNQRTRPIALNKCAAWVRDVPELIHDTTFVDEALVFVRDKKTGKPQAQAGCHDDTVMARAVATYIRLVKLGYLDPIESPSEKYGETEAEEDKAA